MSLSEISTLLFIFENTPSIFVSKKRLYIPVSTVEGLDTFQVMRLSLPSLDFLGNGDVSPEYLPWKIKGRLSTKNMILLVFVVQIYAFKVFIVRFHLGVTSCYCQMKQTCPHISHLLIKCPMKCIQEKSIVLHWHPPLERERNRRLRVLELMTFHISSLDPSSDSVPRDSSN